MTFHMPDSWMPAPNGNPVPVQTVDARFDAANREQVKAMCDRRGVLDVLPMLGIS